MKERQERFKAFLNWFQNCKGSEKGEGQIFFDRLFHNKRLCGRVFAVLSPESPLSERQKAEANRKTK